MSCVFAHVLKCLFCPLYLSKDKEKMKGAESVPFHYGG